MNRRGDLYRDAARDRAPPGPRYRPDSQYRRRSSIDCPPEYEERQFGPSLSEQNLREPAERPSALEQQNEGPRPGADFSRGPPGRRYGMRRSFEFEQYGVDPPQLDNEQHEFGHNTTPMRDYDPTYGRPPPSAFRDSPHMRPPPRYRDGPAREGPHNAPRRRRSVFDPDPGDSMHPMEREGRYREHLAYGGNRSRLSVGDIPPPHRDHVHPEELADMHTWHRNPPPGFDQTGIWPRPRSERMHGQRPSLTADLHAREKRAFDSDREDLARRRPHDFVENNEFPGQGPSARLNAQNPTSPNSRSESRVSIVRVEGRLPQPESRYDQYSSSHGTWYNISTAWPHDSQSWDMSNKLDRPMQGGENSDFSRVNMNASIHQHVSPISTTPIKRRERAGTPLESPTFASGHWDTSSDANFTYFAHSVREKSPVGTDAVTQRGLPHSGAQLESSSVDETAKPRTRVESLNNSSHSLERLANIEDEMEKYKELLEALKADEKEVMSLETTEQDVDDVVEASLTEEKAAELPEPEDGAGDIEDSYENSFIASNFSNLMSVATESPIDVILQRNRRQAQRVEMLAHTSTSVDRLLTSPSDQQFYEANFGIHGRLKATIVKKISRRLLNNAKKRTALKEQYVVKLGEWRREIDLAEQEGAKKKRKLGKAAATANSAVNAAYATPAAAPTRGSRRTTFTSDTVKTEAEFQEALAMLGNVDDDPTNHDPAKSAIEPAMIIDPILRKLTQYQDFSNYVVDPAGDMDRYNARLELVWSKAEVDLFKEKMLQYGKNFHAIAGDLPHKTTKDCVQFYYRGKYPLQLKTAVSKPPRRGKGQATAPKRKDVPEPRERPEAEEEATQGKETTTGRNRRGRGKEQGTSRKDDSVRRQPRVRLREEAVDREEREDEDMDKEGVESSSELPGSAVTRVEPSEGDAQPASDARITENEMADATEHTEKLQTRKLMESRRQSVVVESLENETSQVESTNVPSLKTAPPTETDNLPNTVGEEDPPSLRVDTTDYGPSQAVEVSTADGADIHTDGRQRKRGGRRKDAEELASADVAEGEPGGSNIDSFRSSPQPKRTISYWNSEETIAFRDAYASFGKDWELVAQRVGSKSAKQAQNYYKRNQMEMDLIRLSDTRLRTVSGDRRPYSPPDSESRLFSASHSSEGPRSVLHPPVLIHFEHKEEALVRRPSRLSVLLNGSDGVGSEASLRMDNSTNNSKQHFDPGINLSLQSELAPHRLLDHPSLLTHNSRVSPLQAASAVAALRVTKLGQSRINSQVETFIRKQSATASSTSPDSSKPGFQPISRSFRTPGYPTSTGLLLHDA